MSSDVLVLNRNFYAIHITNLQRAISLVYLEQAYVVDPEYRTYTFEDWKELSQILEEHPSGFLHTPHFRIAVPEVISLRYYDRIPRVEPTFTRKNIYAHYTNRCCYCGKQFPTSDLNLEHVVPKSRGGKTDWSNIVTSCVRCNLRKGSRLPQEARMRLLIKPSKPRPRLGVSLLIRSPIRARLSWQRFIDHAYWNTELED